MIKIEIIKSLIKMKFHELDIIQKSVQLFEYRTKWAEVHHK